MRNRVAAALLFLPLLAVGGYAQAKFTIEGGKAFDFGELRAIVPVTRELRIVNEGADTLRITDVSGSCGCTGTLLSRSDIPPGGDGLLRITFDPAKFKGKVEKVVSMKTNDPADPNPHIVFTATVNQILEFDAGHVVLQTVVDSEASTVVSVRNLSDAPIRITSAKAVPPDLSIEAPSGALQPGESAEFRFHARPAKRGIVKGDITIATDHPSLPTIGLRYFIYSRVPAGASDPPRGK